MHLGLLHVAPEGGLLAGSAVRAMPDRPLHRVRSRPALAVSQWPSPVFQRCSLACFRHPPPTQEAIMLPPSRAVRLWWKIGFSIKPKKPRVLSPSDV